MIDPFVLRSSGRVALIVLNVPSYRNNLVQRSDYNPQSAYQVDLDDSSEGIWRSCFDLRAEVISEYMPGG